LPVYEYLCPKGHEYEKQESFSAAAQQPCPVCGATAQRKISRPAVIFKGSGFYSTDNRRSGASNGSGSSSSSEDGAAGKPSDNGDGHSHGAGSHTHGSEPKVDASVD